MGGDERRLLAKVMELFNKSKRQKKKKNTKSESKTLFEGKTAAVTTKTLKMLRQKQNRTGVTNQICAMNEIGALVIIIILYLNVDYI